MKTVHRASRDDERATAATFALQAAGPTWLVVEKPCGMSVHNDPGRDLCSRVSQAIDAGRLPLASGAGAVRAVHRLDRETSGLVLLAVDADTAAFFGRQFARGQVAKRYLALVHGSLSADAPSLSRGAWTWPLAKAAGGRKDPMGRGVRQDCTTRWQILDTSRHYTLLGCDPATGRKHQIRRHARLAGHAVVGDRRYGSIRSLRFLSTRCGFNRLGLHGHELTLQLPGDSGTATFRSAGLPEPLQRLLEDDR